MRSLTERLREAIRPFYLRRIYFPLFPHRKPDYFDRCWQFPDFQPGDPGRPVAVFLPMNDWHTRMQRTQHLAIALSRRGYVCVYLNPHLGREAPRSFRRAAALAVRTISPNIHELHVHLPREPVFHHRLLLNDESRQIADAVAEVLSRLAAKRTALLVSLPVWMDAAIHLRKSLNAPLVYDCHDFLPGLTGVAPEIAAREPDLFRASDLIVCSANSLLDRAHGFVPAIPSVLLRNAAPADLLGNFSTSPDGPEPVTVGYIGALDSWFDVESWRAAALALPDWRFQLIGRIENKDIAALAELSNVEFTGEVPFHRLGSFLNGFSVATIPFQINPLINGTDPIKVYEYFAAGLPVVSAELPELLRFGDLILTYSTPSGFVEKLQEAVRTDNPSVRNQRRKRASEETWERRGEQLEIELSRLFENLPRATPHRSQ